MGMGSVANMELAATLSITGRCLLQKIPLGIILLKILMILELLPNVQH